MSNPLQGSSLCGAKTREGIPCKGMPMANKRCRMHGGATPKGLASVHYKTGAHSKYLPGKLLPRYHEALHDPELLSLKRDIALVEARLAELQASLPETDNPTTWTELRRLLRQLDFGLRSKDGEEVSRCMQGINELVVSKQEEWRTWKEIENLIHTKRKLVESERLRLVQLNQFITAEQALMFAAAVTDIVKRNVQDQSTLTAIVNELSTLSIKNART